MKKVYRILLPLLLLFCAAAEAEEGAEPFPLRTQFPEVKVISLEALQEQYEDVVIVDSRTRFEYETIHINKAVRVPASSKSFLKLLERYVPDYDSKVVFYCNGVTCSKSYRAAALATRAGYTDAYSFDAGIFAWATANPRFTTLLGKSPMVLEQLISEQHFAAHTIDFETFRKRASEPDAIVIDVRDAAQRRNSDGTRNDLPGMPSLDRTQRLVLYMDLLKRKLERREYIGKQLLIFDATGKQVKWLEYSLKKYGYDHYAFLKGGVYSVTEVVHR
ncbi:MAG: hypothetical protein HOL04_10365 [Gammaproteobacteria bacterium]|nr:hypothetical protein [Gammaproteobacteria bacterium]MBT4605961.1 hypothetical protein [Thiotrichales bacterium]MBT3471362.1 hypothetical protein [Gammaproteobacteria bacterium]MBT4080622.1 hypothetical protein [Gammaproteobacteria bacterium]MBT4330747.1 hypothetical protein [Gammaproteobacteria bacterium]